MDNTYNKVQYSEFTPDRVGQWVFRGETVDEVLEMKKQAFGIIKPVVLAPPATVATPTTQNTPFVPQAPKTYNVNSQANTSSPVCPNCGGAMWNNIPKKRSGEFNLARPDYACKNKECGGAIWPEKGRKGVIADGSNY